jgi:hypothetical protein
MVVYIIYKRQGSSKRYTWRQDVYNKSATAAYLQREAGKKKAEIKK